MVRITKQPKRIKSVVLYKKIAAFTALCILLWIGIHWFSRFASMISLSSSSSDDNNNNNAESGTYEESNTHQLRKKKSLHSNQQQPTKLQLKTESVLSKLRQLTSDIPLSPREDDVTASKFLSAASKECIPGRDDSGGGGEINPTTRRKRECLRHVPLGRQRGGNLEESRKRQKPRIGIMIPPGRLSRSFADWVADALKETGDSRDGLSGIADDVEILVTSHVPVYGYGKSHGYTKLIRLVVLPLSLAAYDAYSSHAAAADSSKPSRRGALGDEGAVSPREPSDGIEDAGNGRNNDNDNGDEGAVSPPSPPTADAIGRTVRSAMRWHCRLSHVAAHTAMLTLTLEDALKDPADVLARTLGFVWREDWEWEGRGGEGSGGGEGGRMSGDGRAGLPPPRRGWKEEARDLVENRRRNESLQRLVDRSALVLDETISSARADNTAFRKAIQGAFASEMRRSSDMTAWPCPSFWEGLGDRKTNGGNDGNVRAMLARDRMEEEQIMMEALRRVAGEMVPNCSDGDPFVRCTVNKDRCEVKGDADCK